MTQRGEEGTPRLPVLSLLREVGRIYARHWRVLVPLALVLLVPQAVSDAIQIDLDTSNLNPVRAALAGAGAVGIIATSLGGEALYAGVITGLVIEWRRGSTGVHLGPIARSLPYGRLIAADLLLTIGTAVGFVLLIVPGVAFATYTLFTTVLIETQRRPVFDAIRKSASLVHGHFWPVLLLTLIALGGTEIVSAALEAPFHGFAAQTAVDLVVEALVEPIQGVATVLAALFLMELHGEPAEHPAAA